MVTALNIADTFIREYGDSLHLSNLKLNKLVYYVQAEALRTMGRPLFDDPIEAWDYGPVEPTVYRAFRGFGAARITAPSQPNSAAQLASEQRQTVETVAKNYGKLTAFDLMMFSHRQGSAWKAAYQPHRNVTITPQMICDSCDGREIPQESRTLTGGIKLAAREHANALRLLEES